MARLPSKSQKNPPRRWYRNMVFRPPQLAERRLEPVVGIELCFQFSYEENIGFPSEDQEEFGVTRHYFSVLCQYFH